MCARHRLGFGPSSLGRLADGSRYIAEALGGLASGAEDWPAARIATHTYDYASAFVTGGEGTVCVTVSGPV